MLFSQGLLACFFAGCAWSVQQAGAGNRNFNPAVHSLIQVRLLPRLLLQSPVLLPLPLHLPCFCCCCST